MNPGNAGVACRISPEPDIQKKIETTASIRAHRLGLMNPDGRG
jgi:hypothetical protein